MSGDDIERGWRTDPRRIYAEARADTDRLIEGLEGRIESRIRETEGRIIKRLDDQERAIERRADAARADDTDTERRIREIEATLAMLKSQNLNEGLTMLRQQVTELRTTNRLLAAGCGLMATLMALTLTALGLLK